MGPNSAVRRHESALSFDARLLPAVVGLETWLVALVALPAPLVARILLAAPLIIVPALLAAMPARTLPLRLTTPDLAPWAALIAGLPLLAAFSVAAGPLAALLSAPWIALGGVLALAALAHAVPRLPGLLRPGRSSELATDGAFGLLGVGALFLLAHRLDVGLLGFGSTTMLLGAVHYHFLGFGLLGLVAVTARRRPWLGWLACLGIVGGMPLSAAGTALAVPPLNWLGVLIIDIGGLAAIVLLLDHARHGSVPGRLLLVSAAAALALGLSLGIGWSTSLFLGLTFLDLEAMVRTHGVLNATGVVLAALALLGRGRRE